MDSILTSIKGLMGISEEYIHFDQIIVMHINSVFMILRQLGVGPTKGFVIEDSSTTWDKFTQTDDIESVKTYIYLKVKLLFDPPLSSAVIESMQRLISELEWRLKVEAESKEELQNG